LQSQGAFRADIGAFPTTVLVVRSAYQHKMRGSPADFGACDHQRKMGWLDMLATGLEAMVHRRRNACLVAAEAGLWVPDKK